MFESDDRPADPHSPGLMHSLKAALATLSSAVHTRAELFVTELEEEREWLKQALVLTLLVVCGFSLGVILLTLFLVAIFWERGWIGAIGGLGLIYLGVGVIAGIKLRSASLKRTGLFRTTVAELGKDSDRLKAWSHD